MTMSPLILPSARFYFVFRRPIVTEPSMGREACEVLYGRVRGEVEGGIEYLLEKRKSDPYADLAPRLLYEGISGGKKQAPTFTP